METEEKILKEFKTKFDDLVKSHKGRIVISSHINPDDDSMSSCLSTYYYLTNILKIQNDIRIIYSNSKVDRWEKIPYFNKVEFRADVSDELTTNDLLILLDCQGYYRISNNSEKIEGLKIPTIVIDHHKTNPDKEYTLFLGFPAIFKCSNAEIFYKLFFSEISPLPNEVAEILLIGIYSDTGGFRYISNEQTSVLADTKEIIEKSNIKVDSVLGKLEKYELPQLKILGQLLTNVEVVENSKWGNFSYSYLKRDICNKFTKEQISSGKAIYGQYQKSIGNSDWGFLIYPVSGMDTQWSLSFRSVPGKPNVRLIAQAIDKNGGGHDAAAGAKMDENELGIKLDEKIIFEKVTEYLKNNTPELIPT